MEECGKHIFEIIKMCLEHPTIFLYVLLTIGVLIIVAIVVGIVALIIIGISTFFKRYFPHSSNWKYQKLVIIKETIDKKTDKNKIEDFDQGREDEDKKKEKEGECRKNSEGNYIGYEEHKE